MRLEEQVQIDNTIITVYEIRPKDLISIYQKVVAEKETVEFKDIFENRALPLLTDANMEAIAELYPSDMEKLYEAFERVNRPFLKRLLPIIQGTELREMLKQFQGSILSDLAETYSGLSLPAIKTP